MKNQVHLTGKILVIGGVTVDTVHLPGRDAPVISPGGAGLYTALGAAAAHGHAALFAQQPRPMPDLLQPIKDRLDWQGPIITEDGLPRLEIAHYGKGRAELIAAHWGAQLTLSVADLPADLSQFGIVHVAALGPTQTQLDFVAAGRARGAGRISAGTYGRAIYGDPGKVLELLQASDFFFMNANEAAGLFGSPGQVVASGEQIVFVTMGADGAMAVTAEGTVSVPAPAVTEVDPTGAGDTFCGAALAVLAGGAGIREAVRQGVALASRSIKRIGPDL